MASKWKGTVYQHWDRVRIRLPHLEKFFPLFNGLTVLEPGCNAGVYTWHIAQYAKACIGVEKQKDYFRQAMVTKEYCGDNVQFLNMSVKSLIRRQERGDLELGYDALFLSYVLYHFDNAEIDLFRKHVLPKCKFVMIVSRNAPRNRKGRRDHNSEKLWDHKRVMRFFEKEGFETALYWHTAKPPKYHLVTASR